MEEIDYLYIPMMEEFFSSKRKNDALMWIPVPCSMLFSDEYQELCTATKCIFVAFILLCGTRGKNEIPFRINYLARISGVNTRTMSKGIKELIGVNMLRQRERKEAEKAEKETKETKEKTHTQADRQTNENGVVAGVDFKSFSKRETVAENQNENEAVFNQSDSTVKNPRSLSRFTLEDCLKYAKQSDGVKNPNALANSLYQTGNADAFIMAMLYPLEAQAEEAKIYGEPICFTNEPCAVCFGAKMADVDGKGYRKCVHCRDERGKSNGFEPKGEFI